MATVEQNSAPPASSAFRTTSFQIDIPYRLWWRSNRTALIEAGVVFLAARLALSVLAVVAAALLPIQSGKHGIYHLTSMTSLDVWARWDSVYFMNIAQYGYGHEPDLAVFFPLYPVFVDVFAPVFGYNWILTGVVVSSLACYAALVYLFKLAAFEFDEEFARRAVLYMTIYPTALFLMAVYSESTFLLFSVATFYHVRRRQWTATAVMAFLAGLARVNSVALFFPIAFEAWHHFKQATESFSWRGVRPYLLALAGAPVGILLFATHLAILTHDPLAYIHHEVAFPWGRHLSFPLVTLGDAARNVIGGFLHDPTAWGRTINAQDLTAGIVLVVASTVAWWKLPRAYAIYATAVTILLLSSEIPGWAMQSMLRYSLTVFPLQFLLARLGANRFWHQVIILVCAPLLGMYTALFAQWYWVF